MGESSAERLAKANKIKDKEMLGNIFNDWDANRDGSINRGELRRVFQKVGMCTNEIDMIFKEIDANNDGQIAYSEFVNWLFCENSDEAAAIKKHIYRTNTPKQAMNEFFEYINELMQVYRDRDDKEVSPNPDGSQDGKQWSLNDLFQKLDANNNGVISQTEFVAGVQGMGYKIDEKMLDEMFKLIDFEIKNQAKKKAPKVTAAMREGDDAAWQAAFGKNWEKAKEKHLGEEDAYAIAGVPNMKGAEPVMYCGNDKDLLAKKAVVHASGVEYEEVMTGGIDKHTGKAKTVRRKVAVGGSRDHQITKKEFETMFKDCLQ